MNITAFILNKLTVETYTLKTLKNGWGTTICVIPKYIWKFFQVLSLY